MTEAERLELDDLLARVMLPTFTAREREIATLAARAALAHAAQQRDTLTLERDELLLDRHQPSRLSPCGHYRVFAMPLMREDGTDEPYCMQCDRDALQADRDTLTAQLEKVKEENERLKKGLSANGHEG